MWQSWLKNEERNKLMEEHNQLECDEVVAECLGGVMETIQLT